MYQGLTDSIIKTHAMLAYTSEPARIKLLSHQLQATKQAFRTYI